MPFSHNGLKTTTGIHRYSGVKRFTGELIHPVLLIFIWKFPRVDLNLESPHVSGRTITDMYQFQSYTPKNFFNAYSFVSAFS